MQNCLHGRPVASEAAAAALSNYSTEPKRVIDIYVQTAESFLALFQVIISVKVFDILQQYMYDKNRRNSHKIGVNYKKSVLTMKISSPSQNKLSEFLEVTAQKGEKI